MNTSTATVFIVDDDPSICRSLSRLVRLAEMKPQTFASAEDFLQLNVKPLQHPACLVVDLQMPGMSGLDLQTRLANSHAACPVIFISGNGSIPETVQAMRQGAVTFLSKPFDNDDLLRAIGEALETHRQLLASGSKLQEVQKRINKLTDREKDVMAWIITGALNKQIAADLDIVESTVKVHRARVLEKMAVSSVAELVRLCDVAGFKAAI